MPDLPRPEQPRPEAPSTDGPTTGATPDEAELARVATPATVRRAPRYGAFIVAGAVVGVLAGLVLAVATSGDSGVTGADGGVLPFLSGQNGVRWILALGLGVPGAFVGGALAVLADRRSTRRHGAGGR
ncbi:histidine kinase [Cellulomonas wangsupingiae]|uniref:histidine kinase n=1 Tax=Cellulomonas wangsupingiae TaxID=2968085 RepID=UPI001D0ECA87|nr:histidine kinase [Cellulomonas wangsupingiae]MCM0640088.1 histidine kinase [Cellulomonas wangsupingiae]